GSAHATSSLGELLARSHEALTIYGRCAREATGLLTHEQHALRSLFAEVWRRGYRLLVPAQAFCCFFRGYFHENISWGILAISAWRLCLDDSDLQQRRRASAGFDGCSEVRFRGGHC